MVHVAVLYKTDRANSTHKWTRRTSAITLSFNNADRPEDLSEQDLRDRLIEMSTYTQDAKILKSLHLKNAAPPPVDFRHS
jgi:hypothetical protein